MQLLKCALLTAAALATAGGAGTAQGANPVRIMPLGDSVTAGDTTASGPWNNGYRAGLYTALTNQKIAFQFVGQHFEGTPGPGQEQPGYPDLAGLGQGGHEGYGGEGTQFLIDNLYKGDGTGFLEVDKPDLVLLDIGINDINGSNPAGPIDARLKQVADIILQHSSARLIVAQITGYTTYNQPVHDYDAYIRDTLVPSYAATGRVTTVDLYSAFLLRDANGNPLLDANGHDEPNASLFSVAPHPNQTGYDIMRATWAPAVEAVVPEPASGKVLGVLCLFSIAWSRSCFRGRRVASLS